MNDFLILKILSNIMKKKVKTMYLINRQVFIEKNKNPGSIVSNVCELQIEDKYVFNFF